MAEGLSKVAAVKRYLSKDAAPIESKEFMAFWRSIDSEDEKVKMASDSIELLKASGEDVVAAW